jgi:hypothetical protein
MLSLRSAVIALVASTALVLVLAGVLSGVFTTEPPPPVGQPVSVHQDGVARAPASPVPPDIAAPAPAAAAPPAPVPATPAPARAAMPSEPTTRHHQVQLAVQQQAAPTTHPPMSVAPAENHRPVSPPPPSALPAHEAKSRTVNTQPCACDGTMRKVSTHWDPPQG